MKKILSAIGVIPNFIIAIIFIVAMYLIWGIGKVFIFFKLALLKIKKDF